MDWREEYKRRLKTPEEALSLSKTMIGLPCKRDWNTSRIFSALAKSQGIANVGVVPRICLAFHDYMKPEYKDRF